LNSKDKEVLSKSANLLGQSKLYEQHDLKMEEN